MIFEDLLRIHWYRSFPVVWNQQNWGFVQAEGRDRSWNSHFFPIRDSTSRTSPPIPACVLVQPGGISAEAALCNKGCLEVFFHDHVGICSRPCFTSGFVAPVQPNVGKPSISLDEKCSETHLPLIIRLSWDKYIVAIAFSSSTLQRYMSSMWWGSPGEEELNI